MSGSTRKRTRVFAGLAAAVLGGAGLAVVPGSAAQAAPSACTIEGYAPTGVILGASAVDKTFSVSVSGCTLEGWAVLVAAFPDEIASHNGATITLSPSVLTNSMAGAVPVYAAAVGAEDAEDDDTAEFEGTFSLKRRSTFGSTFNASPEPVAKGTKITIKGSLGRISWNTGKYVAYAGRAVRVQFRDAGTTTWVNKKTVTTSSTGKVSTTITAVESGSWRLHYGGNSTTGGSDSTADAVAVTS